MKKENFKKGLKIIPELLLLIGGITCLFFELTKASPTSLATIGSLVISILIVLALLIWKNKYLALSISIILGCASFYFILALLSEYSEFPIGSKDGLQMLLIGGLIFGPLLLISTIMPAKYFKMQNKFSTE